MIVDWVKWGNGEASGSLTWSIVRKRGVTAIIDGALVPVGTGPVGTSVELLAFSNQDNLNFDWTDGDVPSVGSSDTVVTETILPAQFDYPIGLGASFKAMAAPHPRFLDVYVQGFNSDMLIEAELSGGGRAHVVIQPTKNPVGDTANNYSFGRYRIAYSGADDELTVTVHTIGPAHPGSVGFPNAGIFAASVAVPIGTCTPHAEGWIQKAYVGYYGRPADFGGLDYWACRMDQEGGDLASIIEAFGESEEYDQRFGALDNTTLINNIYLNLFDRDADAAGLAWYLGQLSSGAMSLQTIVLDILGGAQGLDRTIIANKLAVSDYFTLQVRDGCTYGSANIEAAVELLRSVGAEHSDVGNAHAAIHAFCGF